MKEMFDNPRASSHDPADPDGDITIYFTRPRKKGGTKNSSVVIPKPLLPKVIAILQNVDRGLSPGQLLRPSGEDLKIFTRDVIIPALKKDGLL